MSINKINFAVVGCGHIGKRHATMITNNDNCNLVALVDIRSKSSLALDSAFLDVPFFNSIDSLFESNIEIDVVAIATPNGFHEEQALKVLEHNCHVVIEKPMALTKSGCEKIIYKALQKHKQVFCVMQNRYSPPSIWLKEIVENKILGKIFMVQINCYWNRDDRYYKPNETGRPSSWHGTKDLDGGTLFTQFSHFIDLMYWYFGDITNINARLKDFNHHTITDFEDSGFVNFDFIDGGIGTLNYSTAVWDKNLESSITVIGENGSLKVGGQYMNEVEYCHIKDYTMPVLPPSNPPNDYGPYKGSAANHHFVYENIIEVLSGKGSITTNALEGMKVVEIIERIYGVSN
jgi:UDP-N-acetyl-2-amino-2-deoxyglucuronate dehydrogenase